MKKTLVFILVAVMILAMVPSLATVSSAAIASDFETVYDAATLAKVVKDNKDKNGKTLTLAGQKYEADGFHIVSPIYTQANKVFSQVATGSSFDITKNNDAEGGHIFSITFTVDKFMYNKNGNDSWICLSVCDKQNVTPGAAQYQDGIFILFRSSGKSNPEPQIHFDVNKSFANKTAGTSYQIDAIDNGDGTTKEKYTVVLDLIDGQYHFFLNGNDFTMSDYESKTTGGKNMTQILQGFENNQAWLQITAQTGYIDTEVAENNVFEMTINQFNGRTPSGDNKDIIEDAPVYFAPIASSSTVPANTPAILIDGSLKQADEFEGKGVTTTPSNGMLEITINDGSDCYWVFKTKAEVSYEGMDFGFLSILAKDMIPTFGRTYYCAGDVLTPNDSNATSGWYSETIADGWTYHYFDLSFVWQGRINSIRASMNGTSGLTDEQSVFLIAYAGFFRSEEESYAYAKQYLANLGIEVTTAEQTTRAPRTTAEKKTTTAPVTTTAPAETTAAATEKKCGSSIAFVAILPAIAAAYVFSKKH